MKKESNDIQSKNVVPVLIKVAQWLGLTALGYIVSEKMFAPIVESLGWTSADVQVDENGNVILSEAQMQELKELIKMQTKDSNGNDKYGMYMYKSTKGYKTFREAAIAQTFDLSKPWHEEWLAANTGSGWIKYFSDVKTGYCTYAPSGAVWISPENSMAVLFYNPNGKTYIYTDNWYFTNSNHTWAIQSMVYQSAGGGAIYGGSEHLAFKTIEDYREWLGDSSPYELTIPTYTNGNLTITKEQLINPDIPNIENPVDEVGWLKKIYDRLGDILEQIEKLTQ